MCSCPGTRHTKPFIIKESLALLARKLIINQGNISSSLRKHIHLSVHLCPPCLEVVVVVVAMAAELQEMGAAFNIQATLIYCITAVHTYERTHANR